jgi:SAM-dependent methyltransferase
MTEYSLAISEIEVERYRLMAQVAKDFEGDYWSLAGIEPGAKVADIGCGPGEVTMLLAEKVGGAGRVCGIDSSEESVVYAQTAAARAGTGNVDIVRADAADTGLPAASLDVALARHVLVHNGGREQKIVDHMASLVRPGGHVYLAEFEGTAARIRPHAPDLDDLAHRYGKLHAANGNDFAVGLRLRDFVERAGLEVVEYTGIYRILQPPPGVRTPTWAARQAIVDAGLATDEDVARWDRAFLALDHMQPRPTIYYPVFICVGRRAL